jgi:hypothetical protein
MGKGPATASPLPRTLLRTAADRFQPSRPVKRRRSRTGCFQQVKHVGRIKRAKADLPARHIGNGSFVCGCEHFDNPFDLVWKLEIYETLITAPSRPLPPRLR